MIAQFPILKWLTPGWMDEARRSVQEPCLRKVLDGKEFQGRCLNAGCGEGLYAEFLESFKGLTEITHIDLNAPAFPRLRPDPRHGSFAGSLTALPFENASFDCGLCSEVLEHIPDDQKAAAELARVLKTGAWLLVSVPTPPAPFDPRHVREGYTVATLTTLLEKNGFRVKRHGYDLHGFMRMAYRFWSWQLRVLGRNQRNYCPRGLLRILAYADRALRWGKPWDLVLLAQKS